MRVMSVVGLMLNDMGCGNRLVGFAAVAVSAIDDAFEDGLESDNHYKYTTKYYVFNIYIYIFYAKRH
ncbi:uncharacterized protein G2W53_034031 [Senna tora]|uniref:Uncharacterized protein n=1 Tax=Senna tora TaxID=362788 RepID=A0A834SZP7_9FABA|nr:uncharacterized protein G2W53_034031 [Senna tora]